MGRNIHITYGRKTGYGGDPLCCYRKNGGRFVKYQIGNDNQITFTHRIITIDGVIHKDEIPSR